MIILQKALRVLSEMYLNKPSLRALKRWRKSLTWAGEPELASLRAALDEARVSSKKRIEELLWEYTRLFVGPYKLPAPPWESVYTSSAHLMMQASYDEVLDLYREAGLTVADVDVMADHIGAELNFLAVLRHRMRTKPRERIHAQIAKRFLEEHVRRWVPRFLKDLEHAAELPLYKALAEGSSEVISLLDKKIV